MLRDRIPLVLVFLLSANSLPAEESFQLQLRKRIETANGSGRYHTIHTPTQWNPRQTAIVVCDMWDRHWCPGATARVNEMVSRMNELITAARSKGALIIHCPSDTMAFYETTPQRQLARAAPRAQTRVPLERWCQLDPNREGPLPIDDSDGGCEESSPSKRVWTRQHPGLTIADNDAITDNDDAYHLMKSRGIQNVLVMGVHTNMCVLGRPFGIRQLTRQGLNVALVRDLTDTMYNPAKRPMVSHFTGTDLVIEHIEKFWCPTVTSVDILGGREFRFSADRRPHLVIITAEDEYQTETTLPKFALDQLGRDFRVSFVFADATDAHRLPGLEVVQQADAILLSVRRRPLVSADMDQIRRYASSGRPIIAIRTSSHAFAPRKGSQLPAGVASWETFDRDILGCEYTGHYSNQIPTQVSPPATAHPILADWPREDRTFRSWLYKSKLIASDARPLLMGQAGNNSEPVAWIRESSGQRGRVFYTCLGHPDDFADPAFRQLLVNGIKWATQPSQSAPE